LLSAFDRKEKMKQTENENKVTMKDLPESEQPYRILEMKGPSALTDAQLLAIFLRSGSEGERAIEMACRLLSVVETAGRDPLCAFCQLSLPELRKQKGIGRVKAIEIQAISELAKRLAQKEAAHRVKVSDPASIAQMYMENTRYLKRETAWILYFNSKLELLSEKQLPQGTLNQSLIDVREIFLQGYERGAYGFILLHSHPSGDPSPSLADGEVTKQLSAESRIMKLPMIDHIILGDRDYYSYRENGFDFDAV